MVSAQWSNKREERWQMLRRDADGVLQHPELILQGARFYDWLRVLNLQNLPRVVFFF